MKTIEKKILITGATGFIGHHLNYNLKRDKLVMQRPSSSVAANTNIVFKNIDSHENFDDCFCDVNVVIHCAGIAHFTSASNREIDRRCWEVNVLGTLNFAESAAKAGVKRFIFLSSINVYGLKSSLSPIKIDSPTYPNDVTGVCKLRAEQGIKDISKNTGMEVVILRMPTVYGSGVKGNFSSLLKLTMKRLPLPLGGIRNKRSMVSVQNLVDLISVCIDHPNAANQTFLVSDDDDLSTTDLLMRLGDAADRPARLINIPVFFLKLFANLIGNGTAVNRLTESLQVDISHTKQCLSWIPPHTVDEGLKSCFMIVK